MRLTKWTRAGRNPTGSPSGVWFLVAYLTRELLWPGSFQQPEPWIGLFSNSFSKVVKRPEELLPSLAGDSRSQAQKATDGACRTFAVSWAAVNSTVSRYRGSV